MGYKVKSSKTIQHERNQINVLKKKFRFTQELPRATRKPGNTFTKYGTERRVYTTYAPA